MLLIAFLAGCSSGTKRDDGAAVPPQPASHAAPAVSPTSPTSTSGAAATGSAMPKVYLSTPQGELAVEVEVVSSEAKIQRGLMFREHLPPDQGMLFLMRQEQVWPFWMHNTLIPLDLVFIAKDFTIAGIVENAEPRTDTLRQVEQPSLYVLEVNGGYAAAHKLTRGAKVRFDGVPPR